MAYIDQRDWKCPTFDGLTPSELTWAQMAAYIDGEGSILINPRRNRKDYASQAAGFFLRVHVSNTDVRLMAWLKENFGGSFKDANTAKYYEGKNWKRSYHWTINSNRAAWVLQNCLPFFVLKREQAEIGIQLQESMNLVNRGRELPQHVVEERRGLKKRLLVLKARGLKTEDAQQERIEEVS